MIRVTVEDLQTGDIETQQFENDYLLIVEGDKYLDGIRVFPTTGTTILTVKTDKGESSPESQGDDTPDMESPQKGTRCDS